jgi:CheY-like chemotaxis protein
MMFLATASAQDGSLRRDDRFFHKVSTVFWDLAKFIHIIPKISIKDHMDDYRLFWVNINYLEQRGLLGKREKDAALLESFQLLSVLEEKLKGLKGSKLLSLKDFLGEEYLFLTLQAINSWESIQIRIDNNEAGLNIGSGSGWLQERESELVIIKNDLAKIKSYLLSPSAEHLNQIKRIGEFIKTQEIRILQEKNGASSYSLRSARVFDPYIFKGVAGYDEQISPFPVEGFKILVVDNDEKKIQKIEQILGRHNFLEIALTVGSALAKLKSENYDLVLLDLYIDRYSQERGLDGLLLAKKIREQGINTTIICTSYDAGIITQEKMFNAGIDGYVNTANSTDLEDIDIKMAVWMKHGLIGSVSQTKTFNKLSEKKFDKDIFRGDYSADNPPSKFDISGARILIVDDMFSYHLKDVEKKLKEVFLRDLKCSNLDFAEDIRTATIMMRNNDYDFVFLDNNIEVMGDGLELAKKIKSEKTVTIFGTSSGARDIELKDMFNFGMDAYISFMALDPEDLAYRFSVWASNGIISPILDHQNSNQQDVHLQDLLDERKSILSGQIIDYLGDDAYYKEGLEENEYFSLCLKKALTEGLDKKTEISFFLDSGIMLKMISSMEYLDPKDLGKRMLQLEELVRYLESPQIYQKMNYKQMQELDLIKSSLKVFREEHDKDYVKVNESMLFKSLLDFTNNEASSFLLETSSMLILMDETIRTIIKDGRLEETESELLFGTNGLFYYLVELSERPLLKNRKSFIDLGLLLGTWTLSRDNFEMIIVKHPSFNVYNHRIKKIAKFAGAPELIRPIDTKAITRSSLPRIK